jgi:myo-inositol-1(or 4)-monophosphatase
MAAGVLLIKEAGGLVSDFGGGADYLQSGHVLAGTPDVFDAMASVLRTHLPAELQR